MPPLNHIIWSDARRIIATRYPPVDLFEDISDPRDWDLIIEAESKTNTRIATGIEKLDLVAVKRRVSGTGASYVMAPFVYVSTEWPGRFHDGYFGAYYAAKQFETAVIETAFHSSLFFKASREEAGWLAQKRELVGAIDNMFHDIRDDGAYKVYLHPDPKNYKVPQALARDLRENGSNGIVYASVRNPKGEALAAFWPDVIAVPVQGRHLAYHFDGTRIDLVRDESSGEVWRL